MVLIGERRVKEEKAGPRIGDQVSATGLEASYERATN